MSAREEHQVTFLSPGSFFAETTTKPIARWDPKLAVKIAATIIERHGATPYGFQFSTLLVHDDIDDGQGGKMEVRPKRLRESGIYHLGGRLETRDEVVARNDPRERILAANMTNSGMEIVCITTRSYKSTQPFKEEDFVVDPSTGIVLERGDDPHHVAYRKSVRDALAREYAR